jgi:hypothetical protein
VTAIFDCSLTINFIDDEICGGICEIGIVPTVIIIVMYPPCIGFVINLLTTLPVLLLDLNIEGKVRERERRRKNALRPSVIMMCIQ